MISPEANGKTFGGSVEARMQSYQNSRLNFENEQVGNNVERTNASQTPGFYGDLGIVRKADIFLLTTSNSAPTLLGAKYQLLGETRNKAEKGNFSLSLTTAVGSGSADVGRNDLDSVSGNVKRLKTNTNHLEGGVVFGYRLAKQFLTYGNVYYIDENIDGEVTTTTEALKYSSFDYQQKSLLYSLGLMYLVSSLQIKLDVSHLVSDWSKTAGTQTTNSVNGAIGFNW
jgi:hypothetical protein